MHILIGLALAGAAGWNAFLPLLALALATRLFHRGDLPAPYATLTNPIAIIVLLVILPLEVFADKVPGLDAKNDRAGLLYRPLAGGIVMAAAAWDTVLPGIVAVVIGAIVALGTHLLKVRYRRPLGRILAGMAQPVASLAEDFASIGVSVLALLVPILGFALFLALAALTAGIGGAMRRRPVAS